MQTEHANDIRLGYIDDSDVAYIKPEPEDRCLSLLLDKGGHVNIKDVSGLTPLHYAASRGNKPVLKELLKAKDIALEVTSSVSRACLRRKKLEMHGCGVIRDSKSPV